jgi:hypothetical protein
MHRQLFSGLFRFVIGTFGARQITLWTTENPMMELEMQMISRIYIPLLRKWEWRKINLPKVNILGFVQALGDGAELHRRALSAVYVTALMLDQRNERLPDENLEGRDPRW